MGTFNVDVELSSPKAEERKVALKNVLVDTGSELTWVPSDILAQLQVAPQKKDYRFMMANGQIIVRDVGFAVIRCGEYLTVDEVVFGQPGDCALLGARTLEGFNARVDSTNKRLVAAGPVPATGNQRIG